MSPILSFVTYILSVIATTVVCILGLCASIGIVVVLCERLKTISLARHQLTSDEKDAPNVGTSARDFWEGALVFSIFFTIVGYMGFMVHFWQVLGVMEAALWSTVTLTGIDVGIAMPAAAIIYIDRAIGRMDS